MSRTQISVACASAFWGDTPLAVAQLLGAPELDYIVFDYLSEVTMTLLSRMKKKDPSAGYTPDFFTDVIEPHLEKIASRKIRLVSNAGGMNPQALKDKIDAFARARGLNLKVACVSGDDLLSSGALPPEIRDFDGKNHPTRGWISANAYLGARPIAEVLAHGADIVITGRVVDSALVLGPAVFELGWKWNDYDLLAQASLAGHIIECGTQCCGGNFTDWQSVSGGENVGFPIAILNSNGRFEITKAPGTGGRVSEATVAEQIVYEIGDPGAYALPDVICDFTAVGLRKTAADRVEVLGARGSAPSDHYKAIATVAEGWKISAAALMMGGDAAGKARSVGETVLRRCRAECTRRGWGDYREAQVEALGGGSEVLLRISAAHERPEPLEILAKEIAPAATSLAPGLTQLIGGRASPAPRIQLISFLFPKSAIPSLFHPSEAPSGTRVDESGFEPSFPTAGTARAKGEAELSSLAYARSGDKGNHVNIGVIARSHADFETLRRELTVEKVAAFFSQEFDDPSHPAVDRWEMPGIGAINFLIRDCLGGGGAFSLRSDPQGKAFAQRLLQMRIVP